MADVIWLLVSIAVAVLGSAILIARRSRTWVTAGAAYLVGGLGYSIYAAIELTGAIDQPARHSGEEVAIWCSAIGFFALLIAAGLTLIAVGRPGRRQFLIVFAAVTLVAGTYQFWTTNWAARFGDTTSYCFERHVSGTGTGVQRVPPGVHCFDYERERVVFAPADGISWLALGGSSLFYGFAASFPILGLIWAVRRGRLPYRPEFGGQSPI